MKKIIFFVAAFLSAIGQANAQVISVNDVVIPQGEQQQIQVLYSLDKANAYVGYGFNLNLPDGISTVKGTNGKAIYELDANNNQFSIIVSDNDGFAGYNSGGTINGTEGALLAFTLQADASLAVGSTHVIGVSNVMLSEKEGDDDPKSVLLADFTFTVTIGEPSDKHIILDETSATAPEAAEGVDVRVFRTILANEWSTICLPFAMTETQVKAALGDDVQLGDFNGYDTVEDAGSNIIGIKVKFVEATSIEANHPYIVKVSDAVSKFEVDGVNIAPASKPSVTKGRGKMYGNYTAGKTLDYGMLFLNHNDFWYSIGNTIIKGFRAYFDFRDYLKDFEENYAQTRISMTFDEASGINDTNRETITNNRYYDLQGRRVNNSQLKKGLYIRNGKKEIIK